MLADIWRNDGLHPLPRSSSALHSPNLKRPLIREDLKVIQYQSQEADNTFITSDDTSPYNSTQKWAVKRHYRDDNNQHPHNNTKRGSPESCAIRNFLQVTLSTGKVGCRTGPLLNVFGNEVRIFLCKKLRMGWVQMYSASPTTPMEGYKQNIMHRVIQG